MVMTGAVLEVEECDGGREKKHSSPPRARVRCVGREGMREKERERENKRKDQDTQTKRDNEDKNDRGGRSQPFRAHPLPYRDREWNPRFISVLLPLNGRTLRVKDFLSLHVVNGRCCLCCDRLHNVLPGHILELIL